MNNIREYSTVDIWIKKGMIFYDPKKKRDSAKEDFEKLCRQVRNNRCRHAFVCIIDNDPDKSQIDMNLINKWESDCKYPVKFRLWQPSRSTTRKMK